MTKIKQNDIVERLRKWGKHEVVGGDCFDGADEIERLRAELKSWIDAGQAEIERLRKEITEKDELLQLNREWAEIALNTDDTEIERLRDCYQHEVRRAQLELLPEIERLRQENEDLRLELKMSGGTVEAIAKMADGKYEEAKLLRQDYIDLVQVAANDAIAFKDEIGRLRKELNRTRDAVDIWADKAIEYKQKISSLLDLLRDANKIDEGDFSVNVDEWFARVREAVERG
jgi:hypothetical protein